MKTHKGSYIPLAGAAAALVLIIAAFELLTPATYAQGGAPADSPDVTTGCPLPIKPNWSIHGNCGTTAGSSFVGTTDNQALVVKTNNLERMRINTSGNVGVGTTAPGSKLTVAGMIQSTSGGFKFPDGTMQTSAASPAAWLLGGNAGTNPSSNFIGTTDNQALPFRTNNFERMRIDTSGNLGLGISNPSRAQLETGGANGNTVALFGGNGTGVALIRDYPFIAFNSYFNSGWKSISPGYGGHIGVEQDSGALTFYTNPQASSANAAIAPVEAMRIAQSGYVGIGTTNPRTNLEVSQSDSGGLGAILRISNPAGGFGSSAALDFTTDDVGSNDPGARILASDDNFSSDLFVYNKIPGSATNLLGLTAYFSHGYIQFNPLIVLGTLGGAGSTSLCMNSVSQIATCSSSRRYKTNIADLPLGLSTIMQMHPVTFDWKSSGEHDLGFVAEEMNQVAPILTTRNKDGQIEGVKYDRLTAVLAKGMQEQQQQIEDLKKQDASLQQQVEESNKQIASLQQQMTTLDARLTALESGPKSQNKAEGSDLPWTNAFLLGGGFMLGLLLVKRH